jgi:hypothetical protein
MGLPPPPSESGMQRIHGLGIMVKFTETRQMTGDMAAPVQCVKPKSETGST